MLSSMPAFSSSQFIALAVSMVCIGQDLVCTGCKSCIGEFGVVCIDTTAIFVISLHH